MVGKDGSALSVSGEMTLCGFAAGLVIAVTRPPTVRRALR